MAPWGDLDERLLGCFVREVDYAELQTNGPGAIVTAKSGKGRRRRRGIAATVLWRFGSSLKPPRLLLSSSTVVPSLSAAGSSFGLSCPDRNTRRISMHATIRRYEGVDQNRSAELTSKVNETLVPKLEKLPGFAGYFLLETDNGVFTSLGLFETPEQGMESTKVATTWIREEKLETLIPNEPKITSGKIVARSNRVLVAA